MKNVIPLGNRGPCKLPHPKRVLNANQLDHTLSELGGSLAHLMNTIRQEQHETHAIIMNMSARFADFREAAKRLEKTEHPLSMEEALTAFRFGLHQGEIIVVDEQMDTHLAEQPNLVEPFGDLFAPEIPFCAYFKLGQQQPSRVMLPAGGKSSVSAPLEGFYYFQYGHPDDWMRDVNIVLVGSPMDGNPLYSHAVAYNFGVHEGREVRTSDYLAADKTPYLDALNHAFKVICAFNQAPEHGWPYKNEHDELFLHASTNRETRLNGSFNHYKMETA